MVKNKKVSKKVLFGALAIILVIAFAGWYFFLQGDNSSTEAPLDTNEINYGPPTEAEKEASEAAKNAIIEAQNEQRNQGSSSSNKKQVNVIISSWGQNPDDKSMEINGFVSGVIENGGTCSLSLKKDNKTVTASRKSIADAQVTTCGLIVIKHAKLSVGTWQAVLRYESPKSRGTSTPINVEVN